jgi:hypothetical protein
MEQSTNDAVVKGVQIMLSKEEFARSMGQRSSYLCSVEGCTNHSKRGGVCIKHGAKKKRCSTEGCTNQVIKGGVCKRHGAKVK